MRFFSVKKITYMYYIYTYTKFLPTRSQIFSIAQPLSLNDERTEILLNKKKMSHKQMWQNFCFLKNNNNNL